MPIQAGFRETLLKLHSSATSGVLRCEQGLLKKQLVLEQGFLVFAESNAPDEHLARIMIEMGLLSREKLKVVTSFMKEGRTSEEAVSEAGSSAGDLESARREQATLIVGSLLARSGGTLHFYPGENLVRHKMNLRLAVPEILLVAARRAVKDHNLTPPKDFLQSRLSVSDVGRSGISFPLNATEFFAYSLALEKAEAGDLLSRIPTGELNPKEVLTVLLSLGLIQCEALHDSKPFSPVLEAIDEMLLRFETAGAYEILSVNTEASPAEIQAAYHELARRFHPDRFQSEAFSDEDRSKAERVFASINTAYTTLRDPASRAGYDEKRLARESLVEAAQKAKTTARIDEQEQVEALFQQGRLMLSQREFEKAAEQLRSCVWLQPQIAKYHHYLGLAESEIPRLRKSAEQHFLKAIELENISAQSHLELAKLYIKVALPRKALVQLEEVLHWDSENEEAHQLLLELDETDKSRKPSIAGIKKPLSR
jgi:curved DNA-binding protein CbpA